jgi:hypothetical protein
MKTKSKLHLAGLTMAGFIMLACITTFVSCKKNDLKSSASPIESFATNDNAIIVVPTAPGPENRKSNASEKYNTFYGPQVQMGNGHVRTWANITHDGKPLAIGVEMTDGALSNLPQDPTDFAHATFVLQLHQKDKAVTPFNHVLIDWNVQAH